MNVAHITRAASAICAKVDVDVRYEFNSNAWRWGFYLHGRCVRSIKRASAVLPTAQKVVDEAVIKE